MSVDDHTGYRWPRDGEPLALYAGVDEGPAVLWCPSCQYTRDAAT